MNAGVSLLTSRSINVARHGRGACSVWSTSSWSLIVNLKGMMTMVMRVIGQMMVSLM